MLKLWKWYQNCLAVHPLKTQVISSGFLWGVGDIAAQYITHATAKSRLQLSVTVTFPALFFLSFFLSSCYIFLIFCFFCMFLGNGYVWFVLFWYEFLTLWNGYLWISDFGCIVCLCLRVNLAKWGLLGWFFTVCTDFRSAISRGIFNKWVLANYCLCFSSLFFQCFFLFQSIFC